MCGFILNTSSPHRAAAPHLLQRRTMTTTSAPDLVASCWTSAGDAAPLQNPETSPVPIADRLEAMASTGWSGFGLAHDDLAAARSTLGFSALRRLIDGAGFRYVEVELLSDWWDESLSH